MLQKKNHRCSVRWNLGPAFFGWLVPGLGHWMLGMRRRGIILAVSIACLWLGGLLLGGLSVIDASHHRFWYIGQSLVAPSLAVNYVTQRIKRSQTLRQVDDGLSQEQAAFYRPSFAAINEHGVLFTALAGLLNLLAVIDIVYRPAIPAPTAPR